MQRHFLIVSILLLAAAVAVAAGTSITVTPSEMKSGETKTFTDDGRTITLTRDGDSLRIKVEGAGETKSLTITKNDGAIIIDRDGRERRIIVRSPEINIPHVPHIGRMQTWFVCPKDHTTLRVPEGKEGETYKCPIDGTTMEKRKGHGFSFLFDDDFFRSEDL